MTPTDEKALRAIIEAVYVSEIALANAGLGPPACGITGDTRRPCVLDRGHIGPCADYESNPHEYP